MLREQLIEKGLGERDGFRWRSHEPSRIEAFSDAVFAFAITLLVVSLEVPKTFDELIVTMQGFVPFAIGFAFIFYIWYQQYVFFRRYGLNDVYTICMNGLLMFLVLFYVYPLKFLWSLLSLGIFSGSGPGGSFSDPAHSPIRSEQVPDLMIVYGLGFSAVFVIIALLYKHALTFRVELALTPLEVHDTKDKLHESVIMITTGVISIVVASLRIQSIFFISYVIYWLIGPLQGWHGHWMGKRRKRFE